MFNVANILTAGNLISGILSVVFALQGDLLLAPVFIFVGALFDFLDGFAARLLKTSGELGKQLDSLADMVTFGVAPGIIIMVLLVLGEGESYALTEVAIRENMSAWFLGVKQGDSSMMPFAGLLFPFFAMFRLAKFNIDTRQSESFIGLPTPAATLFFMAFPLAYKWGDNAINQIVFNQWLMIVLVVVFGILMVSELPLFSLKFKRFGWKGNEIRFLFLLISLVLILLFSFWSIALIVFLYLILSIIENIFRKK